jgi:hypothetical protein
VGSVSSARWSVWKVDVSLRSVSLRSVSLRSVSLRSVSLRSVSLGDTEAVYGRQQGRFALTCVHRVSVSLAVTPSNSFLPSFKTLA